MTLTQEENDKIDLIVSRAFESFREKQDRVVDEKINTHQKTCEVGEEFRILKAKFLGLVAGIGIGSAGIGGGVAALVTKLLSGAS